MRRSHLHVLDAVVLAGAVVVVVVVVLRAQVGRASAPLYRVRRGRGRDRGKRRRTSESELSLSSPSESFDAPELANFCTYSARDGEEGQLTPFGRASRARGRGKGQSGRVLTSDLGVVALLVAHEESCGLAVERVGGVRVPQELREEHLEDVDHVEHGRPRLVDDVEADRARQLVDVGCSDTRSRVSVLGIGPSRMLDRARRCMPASGAPRRPPRDASAASASRRPLPQSQESGKKRTHGGRSCW